MIKKKKIKDVMPEQTKKIEKAEIAELAEIEESKENVADLAKAIIDQQLEEIAESEDIENTSDETGVINPDIAEEHAKRNKSKLSKRHEELKNAYKSKAQVTIKQPEEVEQPKPIQMTVGSTPDNPLIVQKNGRNIRIS